jgi:DNA-binding NarL/FixJ family response regulator
LAVNARLGGRHRKLGPVRIVVVDDFEPWRRSIVSILEEDSELKVIDEAADGVAAVQRCWELKPDLVVLDVGLPKLNGFEAAKQIREVSPDTKILFMSANRSGDLIREALRMGAAGYILKSNAVSELLKAVRAAVRERDFLSFTILPEAETDLPEE